MRQKKEEENESGDEEEYCWSCCMNSDKDSKGCSKRLVDGNKFNYSSFNNL